MNQKPSQIRVVVVDDSTFMRELIATVLEADPEIAVVGKAPDPYVARDMIKDLNPDVVTLDIEMPRMDGLTFLRKIMSLRPTPVVMISTLTQAGADATLQALEIGAVDFVAKPTAAIGAAMADLSAELHAKVKAAAHSRVRPYRDVPVPAPVRREHPRKATERIVLIGASTGGVEALKTVLMRLPEDCPPILITQHIPERFTAAFARRLDRECPMKVSEARHSEPIEAGHVYIAPGSHHLELVRSAGRVACALSDGPPVSGHRPSVDVLFRSGARAAGAKAIGVILTGMGRDGAAGLSELRRASGATIGQDEATSLIYGMPRVAFELGAVERQYALADIADAILAAAERDHPQAKIA